MVLLPVIDFLCDDVKHKLVGNRDYRPSYCADDELRS